METPLTSKVAESLLQEITELIVARFQPKKVILFGSQAEGRPKADSDIDLLVVMESSHKPLERISSVRQVLKGVLVPVDGFVLTPEEYEETKKVIGGLAYPATKYGKVLYEKAH